jgi:hypothetical protein
MRTRIAFVLLAALAGGCAGTTVSRVYDAAAAHDLVCDFAEADTTLTPEERKAVETLCALRCVPEHPEP